MPTKYLVLGFTDYVICDDSLRLIKRGKDLQSIMLDIRLNYYRGLHLSNITEFELKLDGQVIPASNIIFQIKGKEFAIHQLPDLYAEFWGIKERVTLEFFGSQIAEGAHDIELTLRFRSPYMRFAPGVYATIDSSARKRLTLRTLDLSSENSQFNAVQPASEVKS
jgi:hypothetical protein